MSLGTAPNPVEHDGIRPGPDPISRPASPISVPSARSSRATSRSTRAAAGRPRCGGPSSAYRRRLFRRRESGPVARQGAEILPAGTDVVSYAIVGNVRRASSSRSQRRSHISRKRCLHRKLLAYQCGTAPINKPQVPKPERFRRVGVGILNTLCAEDRHAHIREARSRHRDRGSAD